jgi:hypothetical protein
VLERVLGLGPADLDALAAQGIIAG